jgi:hypothetical protein
MSQSPPVPPYKQADLYPNRQPATFLFPSDSNILSDNDIKKILSFNYQPQKLNRIVVIPVGQMQWSGWSGELDKAEAEVQRMFINKLKQAEPIYDASYLPPLLIPEDKSIAHLRAAAAHYQSDLLIIYKASFADYEKYRLSNPDKAQAYCNLEAVLLDIRTGIVPFTLMVNRTFSTEEKKTDINFYETMRRTELFALESALNEVGNKIVDYLSNISKIN